MFPTQVTTFSQCFSPRTFARQESPPFPRKNQVAAYLAGTSAGKCKELPGALVLFVGKSMGVWDEKNGHLTVYLFQIWRIQKKGDMYEHLGTKSYVCSWYFSRLDYFQVKSMLYLVVENHYITNYPCKSTIVRKKVHTVSPKSTIFSYTSHPLYVPCSNARLFVARNATKVSFGNIWDKISASQRCSWAGPAGFSWDVKEISVEPSLEYHGTHIWLVIGTFLFSIYWEQSSELTNIFQMDWHHQPDNIYIYIYMYAYIDTHYVFLFLCMYPI